MLDAPIGDAGERRSAQPTWTQVQTIVQIVTEVNPVSKQGVVVNTKTMQHLMRRHDVEVARSRPYGHAVQDEPLSLRRSQGKEDSWTSLPSSRRRVR